MTHDYAVLNDGETYTDLTGCRVARVTSHADSADVAIEYFDLATLVRLGLGATTKPPRVRESLPKFESALLEGQA
jgi:hypothetical protein